jgi:hypothetical protein
MHKPHEHFYVCSALFFCNTARDPSFLRNTGLELALAKLQKVAEAEAFVPSFAPLPSFLDSPKDCPLCCQHGSKTIER